MRKLYSRIHDFSYSISPFLSIWKLLLAMFSVIGGIYFIIDYFFISHDNVISITYNFWREFVNTLNNLQIWTNNKLKILLGSIISISVIIIIILTCVYIIKILKRKFPNRLYLSIKNISKSYDNHITNAIFNSRPAKKHKNEMLGWDILASAALNGYGDPDVIKQHCERGKDNLQYIFCNFQSYAHAVSNVLVNLEKIKCESGYPRILTILNRTLFEWYNPFPVEFFDKSKSVMFFSSNEFWENYKKNIENIKDQSKKLQMCRLVAHRPRSELLKEIDDYRIISEDAMTIQNAKIEIEKYGDDIEWHPSIKNILKSDTNEYNDFLINLIGKPIHNTHNYTNKDLIKVDFRTKYHNGFDDSGKGNVFLRYLKDFQDISELEIYDDIFIIKLSKNMCFGLVYIADEARDINGFRFLVEQELSPSYDIYLDYTYKINYSKLIRAWKNAHKNFQVCS